MAIMSTNQAVSKGNFITSAHLHFMLFNLCYCSPQAAHAPSVDFDNTSFVRKMLQGESEKLLLPGTCSLDLRQRKFKKPLCAFTLTPLARMAWLKRAMLMQVMVPSGSVVLCIHSLQMFNEVPLLRTSSGSIKAKGTGENAPRPEKQLYLTRLKGPLATLWFFAKHLLAWSHDYWARIIN